MRADYLDRFGHLFTGGFARILAEGAVFTQAYQDHATTVTAVGHAAIATGTVPARNGIIGNDFFDRVEGREVYAAFDPAVHILGHPDAEGRSPVRLRTTGLADWLKADRPGSLVFSTALKDRSAIMMGGRSPDGAYWYDASAEELVTSSYYRSEVPDWVEDFASRDRAASYFNQVWDRVLPTEAYEGVSREDWFEAEGEGWPRTFPHSLRHLFPEGTPESPGAAYFESFLDTPFADEVILQFAQTAIAKEGLGSDDTPDLLFLGASGADYIGHRWGPYSQEVQDYYLRLDRYLGVLFDSLDESIGSDRWSLVLSADHGVAAVPEEASRWGEDAKRISEQTYSNEFGAALRDALDGTRIEPAPMLRWMDGPYLLSETASGGELRRLRRAIADRFAEIDFVAAAHTSEEVAEADPRGDEIIHRFRRSFDPQRSPDVMFALKPNYIVGASTASHGSPYWYDRHVPLVFMGPGIRPGRHDRVVRSVDIAPTLASLMAIPLPDDLDGRPLGEVVRGRNSSESLGQRRPD